MPDSLWVLLLLLPVAVYFGYRVGNKNTQQTNTSNPSRYFKGINYLLNEQPDKAIDIFIEQIQVDNELVETHLALGNLFRRRGEVDRAIRIHQNLIARPTLDSELRNLALKELSQDYLSAGLYDRAETILIELKKLDAFKQFALESLISVYQQLKDWPQAIESALHLQKIGVGSQVTPLSHFYCELADIEFGNSNNKDAAAYLQKALKIEPLSLRANLTLSKHYMENCAYTKAKKLFQILNQNHQSYLAEYIDEMRHCYAELGKQSEYIHILESAVEQTENSHAIPEYIKAITKSEDPATIEQKLLTQVAEHGSNVALLELLKFYRDHSDELHQLRFQSIMQSIASFESKSDSYHCSDCGYSAQQLLWQCPSCKLWSTMQSRESTASIHSEIVNVK